MLGRIATPPVARGWLTNPQGVGRKRERWRRQEGSSVAHYLMGKFIKKFVNLAHTLSCKFNKNINRNWGKSEIAALESQPLQCPFPSPSFLFCPVATPAAWQDAQQEIHAGVIFFFLSADSTCHTTSLNALTRQGVASVSHSSPPHHFTVYCLFFLACPCPLSLLAFRFVVQLLLLLLSVVSPCPFVFAALCRIINFAQLFACQRITLPPPPLPPRLLLVSCLRM